MNRWRDWIYHASRSRGFLWKFAIAALLLGAATGYLLSQRPSPTSFVLGERVLGTVGLQATDEDEALPEVSAPSPELLAGLAEELAAPGIEFRDLVLAVPVFAPHFGAIDHDRIGEIFRSRFDTAEAALALDYLAAWNAPTGDAYDRLVAAAKTANPPRFVRYMLGRLEMKRREYRAAYEYFRPEAELADAWESRFGAVAALAHTEDFAALAQLEADPRFAPYFDSHVRLQMAIGRKDWRGIAKWVPLTQIDSYQSNVIVVTVVAGLAWAFLLSNLFEMPRFLSARTGLGLGAFLAGVASTTVTIYLVILQDDFLHLARGNDPYHTFAYYIAGVGLREELAKLLLFAPFLPILLKRDSELEALMVASFVGLGFAIEENGGYFMLSEAASAPGRFLTANFLHVVLTGLNGLALYHAAGRWRGGMNHFLAVFPATVLIHGLYDALPDIQEAELGTFGAMMLYILVAQYYFRTLHPLRDGKRRTVSLTGAFVFGVSVFAATVVAFQMATLGARAGSALMLTELTGTGVLLVLFFREFYEALAP